MRRDQNVERIINLSSLNTAVLLADVTHCLNEGPPTRINRVPKDTWSHLRHRSKRRRIVLRVLQNYYGKPVQIQNLSSEAFLVLAEELGLKGPWDSRYKLVVAVANAIFKAE